jgi:hypothetical protein
MLRCWANFAEQASQRQLTLFSFYAQTLPPDTLDRRGSQIISNRESLMGAAQQVQLHRLLHTHLNKFE